MHPDILKDLLIVFTLGGIVVYVFHSLRLPSLVGLLVTGVVVGPTGLSLVGDVETVKLLAEIGVVLLLFTIGLEISLGHLLKMLRIILGCGGFQVLLCIVGTAAAMSKAFDGLATPVFMGFLVAMSSTAIVLRLLNDRAELTAPHGRIALGVLLFQDLLVVPFMLVTPILAGQTAGLNAIAISLAKAAALLTGVLLAGRWLVPHLLFRILKTRSRELFLTVLVLFSIGTAWVTSWSGLSLALGAFLAGLAISESEYSQQVLSEALPFRDIFSGLFFVSIGMLLDVRFIAEQYRLVAIMVFMILALKFLSSALPTFVLGYPVRICVLVGLSLAQIGEFSFVLSQAGLSLGLIGMREYQVFLAAAVMTMILTPFLMQAGRRLAMHIGQLPSWFKPISILHNGTKPHSSLKDHVVIAGYGLNGRNIAQSLRTAGVPYVILEMNPETVRRLRAEGQPIYFGDCTQPAVLHKVNLERARVLVIAISDPASTRQATRIARMENPGIYIVVRTRFQSEVDELRKLGADDVIPEEFETSIEIFSRVLQRYDVPRNVVMDVVAEVRSDMYQMLRVPHLRSEQSPLPREALESVATDLILIRPDSPAADRTIGELGIRKSVGATVLAVKSEGQLHGNPGPDFRLSAGDVAVLVGSREQLDRALGFLDPPKSL